MAASYQSAVRRVQEGYFLSSYIKTPFPSPLQSKALCMQMDQKLCNQWLSFGSHEAEFFHFILFSPQVCFSQSLRNIIWGWLLCIPCFLVSTAPPALFAEQQSLVLAGAEICVLTRIQGNIQAMGNVLEGAEGRFRGCICCQCVEEVESWVD